MGGPRGPNSAAGPPSLKDSGGQDEAKIVDFPKFFQYFSASRHFGSLLLLFLSVLLLAATLTCFRTTNR